MAVRTPWRSLLADEGLDGSLRSLKEIKKPMTPRSVPTALSPAPTWGAGLGGETGRVSPGARCCAADRPAQAGSRQQQSATGRLAPGAQGPRPSDSCSHISAGLLSSDGSADAEGCLSYVALSWGGGALSTQAEPLGPRSAGVLGTGAPGEVGSPRGIYCFVEKQSGPHKGDRCATSKEA